MIMASLISFKLLGDYRNEKIATRPLLPVNFQHLDHREVQCAECHHNFIDDTGGGSCYLCHKTDPELTHSIEEMFHTFCRNCHLQARLETGKSGPIRQCGNCHTGT